VPVPVLKQGDYLIASVQSAMTDSDAQRLQDDLMEQVGRYRSRGIIVDVTAMDVMDSFAARSLRTIAHMTSLRGAVTVIVGIQPEVAFAMVQLGMRLEDVHTALDLEEGLEFLRRRPGSDGSSA
jgi:rsbT antagonist protein RsbS